MEIIYFCTPNYRSFFIIKDKSVSRLARCWFNGHLPLAALHCGGGRGPRTAQTNTQRRTNTGQGWHQTNPLNCRLHRTNYWHKTGTMAHFWRGAQGECVAMCVCAVDRTCMWSWVSVCVYELILFENVRRLRTEGFRFSKWKKSQWHLQTPSPVLKRLNTLTYLNLWCVGLVSLELPSSCHEQIVIFWCTKFDQYFWSFQIGWGWDRLGHIHGNRACNAPTWLAWPSRRRRVTKRKCDHLGHLSGGYYHGL